MGNGLKRASAAAAATRLVLTPKRRLVLTVIRDWTPRNGRNFPDHRAVAVACGKAYSSADWAHEPVRALIAMGFVSVTGRAHGARMYAITDAGRAALQVSA